MVRLLTAVIRTLVRFPLFQLAFVVAILLLLQAPDNDSTFGQIFKGMDKLLPRSALSEVMNAPEIASHSGHPRRSQIVCAMSAAFLSAYNTEQSWTR
jgi:hypothetical protein